MKINPRENTIVIQDITQFPVTTLPNGVQIYFEVLNKNNPQINKKSKIKLNVSKRDKNGSFVPGGTYVNQGILYSLNNQSNPKAKRRLNPPLFEAVQQMHKGDIAWVLLTPKTDITIQQDIYVRIEVLEVEFIKISFPELSYQEQIEMIDEYKKKADTLFIEALNIDDEKLREDYLKQSYEQYLKCSTYFLQVPKKKVKLFDKKQMTEHYDFGTKVFNNYCKCMYKLKMTDEALNQISIFEKILRNFKMPFLIKILKTKAIIFQKIKSDKLDETVKEILQEEKNPKEREFYEKMIKPIQKENPQVNKAFYKALRNADKEDFRESVLKKVNLDIGFTNQNEDKKVIFDNGSDDDNDDSFEQMLDEQSQNQ